MNTKCIECGYGKRLNSANEHYCAYLEIVGHKRPVKANKCELYKENPKVNNHLTKQ